MFCVLLSALINEDAAACSALCTRKGVALSLLRGVFFIAARSSVKCVDRHVCESLFLGGCKASIDVSEGGGGLHSSQSSLG